MAKKLITREVCVLQPEHARKAQDTPSIPGERSKKKKRLEYIGTLIGNGVFVRADFAYAKCKEDGREYRVNGNHTSTVLCECIDNSEMPPFPDNVPLVIERWECDKLIELSEIFDTYDNPQSNRTAGDRLGVHIANHPQEMDGLTRDIAAAALKGINLARRLSRNPDEPALRTWDLGELLRNRDVVEFCHFLQPFRDDSWQAWKHPGLCAAVFKSWRENASAAEAVWRECFNEEDGDENSDSRKFANRMKTEKGRKQRNADYFYNEALRYWARHRKVAV